MSVTDILLVKIIPAKAYASETCMTNSWYKILCNLTKVTKRLTQDVRERMGDTKEVNLTCTHATADQSRVILWTGNTKELAYICIILKFHYQFDLYCCI